MRQKNLQTKMIKDEYKQHIQDETKSFDIEFTITRILVVLYIIFMACLFGWFIYLCIS